MAHLDPELLALLALGEDAASPEERAHMDGCEACRAELQGFARTVAASRGGAEPLTSPHPRVWAGIARSLGLADAGAPLLGDRTRRRLGRRPVVLVAAVAALALLAAGTSALLLRSVQPQTVATATLQPFPDWPGRSGTAVLQRLPDGRQVVAVRTSVTAERGFEHEVWLMTDGARRLVSLGLLRGSSGTFTVPAGVDLGRFRLVDVSDEPEDGNPAHSGDSIVRGTLRG